MSRRVLVTGGAGFIGSHLVDRLAAEGMEIVVLDDLSSGRIANLGAHHASPRVRVVRVDIARDDVTRHFEGIDWVFHLAAHADVVPSIEQPRQYHEANVDGTFRVLEAARAARVRRFVYAASSSRYGVPDLYPTPETAAARPEYPYALTKHMGEEMVLHWACVYRLPAVSLRLFNVYGPRSRTTGAYGAMFGVFLAQKLARVPFTVVGDGTQARDFTFVTDVVEAFVRAADSDLAGEALNVGSGACHSVLRIVELLGGQVTFVPKRPREPHRTLADCQKIARLLGWRPRVSLEEGVRTMLDHIGDFRDAPVWTPQSIAHATRAWFASFGEGA